MKVYEFPVSVVYGPGDSNDTLLEVELTDQEASLLEAEVSKPGAYYEQLHQCSALKPLYDRLYEIAVQQVTDEIRDFSDSLDKELLADPNWRADALYSISILFPEELEEIMMDHE